MTPHADRPRELAAFLKAHRSRLDPADVGPSTPGQPRRVPGLRREEVAQLASISTDYYTRLEQGRLAGASPGVLDALAGALRLGEDERSYLFQLAGKTDQRPRKPTGPEGVRPQLQQLLDNLRDSPALVLGRYLDILAWNPLATAVFRDFARVPRLERNFLRMLFLDPQIRGRYTDWAPLARICVGFVRVTTNGHSEPRISSLIGELSLTDADFRTWWAEQHTSYETNGTKHLTHPDVGDYALDWQVLQTLGEQQLLMVMTAPPQSDSLAVLRRLAR
ncbi:helix-turn-helix transcriptional regulator [Streptomyces malaysiensis subsp. malaysiensis]|uniref:helix-turn-helix transcriptional regulator n=1 Tax=Streptomyces malaysiensis TaxID=92644 RepID=UPI0024C06032|nr:helix-turn-helix transcriptional regulator [Streptomyces sp. NA07423]WHX23687.1 helix-turn-helix transcriptional regulator [Streptomyces sp. NA07423]